MHCETSEFILGIVAIKGGPNCVFLSKSALIENKIKYLSNNWLSTTKLQTLKERRIRSEMITTYKILKEYINFDRDTWFQQVGDEPVRHTRFTTHPLNLVHKNAKTEVRKNSFSVRKPAICNNLPSKVKGSTSIQSSKNNYDQFC